MKKGRFSQRIPHSWLGSGRNGYHHGVARGQVSRTGSELRRKNGNRYVLFLDHRYAVTHSLMMDAMVGIVGKINQDGKQMKSIVDCFLKCGFSLTQPCLTMCLRRAGSG